MWAVLRRAFHQQPRQGLKASSKIATPVPTRRRRHLPKPYPISSPENAFLHQTLCTGRVCDLQDAWYASVCLRTAAGHLGRLTRAPSDVPAAPLTTKYLQAPLLRLHPLRHAFPECPVNTGVDLSLSTAEPTIRGTPPPVITKTVSLKPVKSPKSQVMCDHHSTSLAWFTRKNRRTCFSGVLPRTDVVHVFERTFLFFLDDRPWFLLETFNNLGSTCFPSLSALLTLQVLHCVSRKSGIVFCLGMFPACNSNHIPTLPPISTLLCRFTKTSTNIPRRTQRDMRMSGRPGGFSYAGVDLMGSAKGGGLFGAHAESGASLGGPPPVPGIVQHGVAPPVPPMAREAVARVDGGGGIGAVSFVVAQPAIVR